MSHQYSISSPDRLLMRLEHAVHSGQKVTFLLGSGLTCPNANGKERGIPGATEMVERVRKSFTAPDELKDLDAVLQTTPDVRKYQAAMQFMIECRGQSALNSYASFPSFSSVIIGAHLNF